MNIRREPTYLSRDVWRALLLIAKSGDDDAVIHNRELKTVDQVADKLLRELIISKYPQLLEHQKKVEQLEKELLKTL